MSGQKLIPYVHPKDGETWEYFFVDEVSQIIYFVKKHNGKRIKFTTKEKYPDGGVKAKRYANAEFDRRTGKKTKHVKSLISDELELWLKVKETEDLAYDSMNNVKRAAKQIKEFWGEMLPGEITVDNATEWYVFWKKKHPDISIENAAKYMNNFCQYLSLKRINGQPLIYGVPTFYDPDRKKAMIKRKGKTKNVFSVAEFRAVRHYAENWIEGLIVHFMYVMATRIEETLQTEFGVHIILDIEVPVYRWFYGSNKADLAGEHALHPSLIEPLKRLRDLRRAEGTNLLFPQVFDNQKPMAEQQIDWAGWRYRVNIGWHWTSKTFRHTALTNLFNDPKNPHAAIIKLYRVSLQVALETYIKVTPESVMLLRDAIKVEV
ncbi:hypothetical protein [Bdellovibrio sp. HCB288]|uniref:hypothetical protein n=1 Tax=Bdellovibrio sp. HCB288 TaxID=3394355 RepID=UPI0039B60773